jgi:cytoskeletal protein CcmA (bactofilin family)
MFNRPAKSAAADGRTPKVASLLTSDLTVTGDIAGDGELQVDCVVRGDVAVGRLCIGETGAVEGAITAESVDVRGRVAGSITARQVRLFASARVDGDITHEELTVDAGAHFEGRSQSMHRPAAAPKLAISQG